MRWEEERYRPMSCSLTVTRTIRKFINISFRRSDVGKFAALALNQHPPGWMGQIELYRQVWFSASQPSAAVFL